VNSAGIGRMDYHDNPRYRYVEYCTPPPTQARSHEGHLTDLGSIRRSDDRRSGPCPPTVERHS
jgi:hypothetical protein